MRKINDTDRLNFLLKYFNICDIGDEVAIPGVCINSEELEDDLTWGPEFGERNTRQSHFKSWNDDVRDIIDRAIESRQKISKEEEGRKK